MPVRVPVEIDESVTSWTITESIKSRIVVPTHSTL
jgi:hypothetical protein